MPAPAEGRSALVLGGGLSGLAAAWALARGGFREVTLVERGTRLGGLAGSIERGGHFYPLGYHHILHLDHTLLFFLNEIGAAPSVRWRRIRMFFRTAGRSYDFANPFDLLRFPMSLPDKARFAALMLRAFAKSDWSDWVGRTGEELISSWASRGVREAVFEPLARLKFDRPTAEVSAAWLGARLHFREGAAALGYIPGTNWTTTLCDGVARIVHEAGVRTLTGVAVEKVELRGDRLHEVTLSDGTTLGGDVVVSSLPASVFCDLVPAESTPSLRRIRYTALLSAIGVTLQPVLPDFYWMTLAQEGLSAGGLFLLSSLNPTIGEPGEACLNFVNHLASRDDRRFAASDDELWHGYAQDFERIFGQPLALRWKVVNRVPLYSPIFDRDYVNPPVRSESLRNVYFAGNYRTFPSIASTGTALLSGLEAADAVLGDGAGFARRALAYRAGRRARA